ncbi:MAG: GntR family transcriptional regulator [Verrucomicrobia bacterium]|nr:GntR family transcriptional regulator [Verrucomicrobiota bacterium]
MKNVNSDIAYDHIRKKILSGEYPPGQALMTKDLSMEIGVSRTPVRDALRQLEADGLVIIRAHLGASVKTMDLKEYRELCGMRLALESYAAGLAAGHRTVADLQEIKFALASMRKLTEKIVAAKDEEPLLAELSREDVRFHIAIMSAAKSDLIKKEILRLHLINRVVVGPAPGAAKVVVPKEERNANRLAVMKSHEEIYRAIEKGDAPAAKQAMEDHIQDIIDKNIRMMAREEGGAMSRELTEEELSYSA